MNTGTGRTVGAVRPRAAEPAGEAEPGHTGVADAVHEALHRTTRGNHADSADA